MAPKNKNKIWLIGGTGFIGKWLAKFYNSSELLVTGKNLDVQNHTLVKKTLQDFKPDRIFYLAGVTTIAESFVYPGLTAEVNKNGLINLIKSAADIGFSGKILYVSSGEVYGKSNLPNQLFNEESPTFSANPYAESKLAAEDYIIGEGGALGIDVLIARPFNQIGPSQTTRFLVPRIAEQLAKIIGSEIEPSISLKNLNGSRDFIDVRDAVAAYDRIIELGKSGSIYNVCSGHSTSIGEILSLMVSVFGIEQLDVVDLDNGGKSDHSLGDNRKLKQDFSWRPKISLVKTLEEVCWQYLPKK